MLRDVDAKIWRKDEKNVNLETVYLFFQNVFNWNRISLTFRCLEDCFESQKGKGINFPRTLLKKAQNTQLWGSIIRDRFINYLIFLRPPPAAFFLITVASASSSFRTKLPRSPADSAWRNLWTLPSCLLSFYVFIELSRRESRLNRIQLESVELREINLWKKGFSLQEHMSVELFMWQYKVNAEGAHTQTKPS